MMPAAKAAEALELAHKAVMLADLQAAAKLAHAAAAASHEMGFGKPPNLGPDDVIHIGDVVQHLPKPDAPAAPVPSLVSPVPAGISKGIAAALAGLALVAGGGATLGLMSLLKPTVPVPVVAPAPSPTPVQTSVPATAASAFDAVTEEQQPDGTWKEIKRERLNPKGTP